MYGADLFKILMTLGIFLFGSVWAFKNLQFIDDWIKQKAGLSDIKDENGIIQRTTESGTELNISVKDDDKEASNTAE
jgi:hypothetical protein